jgi:quinohemoprotein ethanol dehydrogenase
VLHDGLLRERGMPQFEELSDGEVEDLRHYIRQRARERLAPAPGQKTNRGLHEGQ